MGLRFRGHPRAAGHCRRPKEEVALALLCSLRRPAAGNCRWIQPDIRLRTDTASAGKDRSQAEEQERSLGHTQRVHGQRRLHAGVRACGASRARHTVGVIGGVEPSCRTTRRPLKRRPPTRWLAGAHHLDLTQSRLPDGLPARESSMLVGKMDTALARARTHSSYRIDGKRTQLQARIT